MSGWGSRFTLVALTFIGQALCYAVRVDMSVAIVAMVNRSECSKLHIHFEVVSFLSLDLQPEVLTMHNGETNALVKKLVLESNVGSPYFDQFLTKSNF